ncbi:hypothetical protein [Planococcus sp. ISL-109]|uniref:hypothetical protein n=1 Tax=Planococcus sp. ISL-109 TaxID=2819166 RepID=UPI001BED1A11|nr:hypothetical protein [Planococcus sp. ISL-109]MBT2583804.1 hypothetical protein [Planococcus sp. ISL-109]
MSPYDFFSYWLNRIAQGGEVLAPGRKGKQVQLIDVRDLAEWIVSMVEENVTGTFNAAGPETALTMEDLLQECQSTLETDAELVWANESFLLAKGVGFWSELPLWIPDREKMEGFLALDIQKALGAGFSFRPLAETIRDRHVWELAHAYLERKEGLDAEKEKAVLKMWKERVE